MMKPALVLSSHTVALGVIRSLGEKGVPIVLFCYHDGEMAHLSRYVQEVIRVPHPEVNEIRFINMIMEQKERFVGSFLVPCSDETLVAVSRHKQQLTEHFVVACPDSEVVTRYIEKKYTYRLAEAAGVPVPKTCLPTCVEDVERFAADLEFPCLVKPSQSHLFYKRFQKKMVPVKNRDQMVAVYQMAAENHLEVMLQEIIPGEDDAVVNYNAYTWQGQALTEFTSRHIRNAPYRWGAPRVALSEWIPEILEPGRKVLQAIGFCGYSCTEFKRDARDGIYKLMEVNGRHNLSGLLAVRCGINFPWLHYRHLMEKKIPQATTYRKGVYWVDMTRDLGYSLKCLWQERYPLSVYLKPYLEPHVFAIWDIKDIKPFLQRIGFIMKKSINFRWGEREKQPASSLQFI